MKAQSNTGLWFAVAGVGGLGAYALHRSLQGSQSNPGTGDPEAQASAALARVGAFPLDSARPVKPAHNVSTSRAPVGKGVKLRRRISRRFDRIFARYGKDLPLPYLRALAKRESNMDPAEQSGPAWGLLQVVEVVRKDFNKAHGTHYSRRDLLDPTINVSIATWLLRIIIGSYAKHHPDVPNMQLNWDNPRFVELLTFGWNAGWSERAGLGRVARYLERQRKHDEITVELIHGNARAAGGVRFLRETGRMRWSKSVASYYLSERLHEQRLIAQGNRSDS